MMGGGRGRFENLYCNGNATTTTYCCMWNTKRFVGYDGVSSARHIHIHELRAQGDHFYDNGVDNKWLESLMEAVGQ